MNAAEMTPRRWKALLAQVAERSADCGEYPTVEMRIVLQALIARMAKGEPPPSRGEWGAELGIEKRRLGATVTDLGNCGLVLWVKQGNRPAAYEVQVDQVRRWAAGIVKLARPERDEIGTTNGPERDGFGTTVGDLRCGNGTGAAEWRGYRTTNGPERDENGTAPRAGAAHFSSFLSAAAQAPDGMPLTPPTPADAHDLHAAMVALLDAIGVRTSTPFVKSTVWSWTDTYTLSEVRRATEAAGDAGVLSLRFIKKCLMNEHVRLEPTRSPRLTTLAEWKRDHPEVG